MHEVEVYMYVFFVVLVVVNIHTISVSYIAELFKQVLTADARENIFEELECLQYIQCKYLCIS